ncbi:MAG: GTPase, partial [Phycisphaerae bacterium]
MKFAIIGPPFSGKSTLFSAITGQPPDPAHAGTERLAVVKVPDPRLDFLASLHKPKKYTEATLEFVDTPGISLDDPHGQAEFRRCLPTLRQCDGLVAVVRAFASDSIPPYRDRVDPAADLAELHTELIFADLEQVTNRIERLDAQTKKGGKPADAAKRERPLLERIREALESEQPVRGVLHSNEEAQIISGFGFLTLLPMVVVVNVSEDQLHDPPPFEHEHARMTIALSAEIEAEIAQLDAADRPAFQADLGIEQPASRRLLRACYAAAGLVSFLTCGPDEVRAWTI